MAYADSIRIDSATVEGIATLLEGLMTTFVIGTSGGINTTAGPFVDTGCSFSVTIAAGQKIALAASLNLSHSISGDWIQATFDRDGASIGQNMYFQARGSATNGADDSLVLFAIDSPTAGSHTYKVRWGTTAATAYSYACVMIGIPLQSN